jgi:spore germination cell wall hydrolase CwlJ-like protein
VKVAYRALLVCLLVKLWFAAPALAGETVVPKPSPGGVTEIQKSPGRSLDWTPGEESEEEEGGEEEGVEEEEEPPRRQPRRPSRGEEEEGEEEDGEWTPGGGEDEEEPAPRRPSKPRRQPNPRQEEEPEEDQEQEPRRPGRSGPRIGQGSARGFAGKFCNNTGNELFCMTCNIFHEAANEPYLGKVMVGRTVMERIQWGKWGSSACSVIWARKQFSWTWITRNKHLPPDSRLEQSYRAAVQAMREGANGASHYFNFRLVNPPWARQCTRAPIYRQFSQAAVGQHIFLSCPSYYASMELGADGKKEE